MEELVKAVREHSGMSDREIIDAGEHGADAGWPGFTYYSDTGRFYDDYADLIWDQLAEDADDVGEKHALGLLASFRAAAQVDSDATFRDLLAWHALEEAGRWLASQEDEE